MNDNFLDGLTLKIFSLNDQNEQVQTSFKNPQWEEVTIAITKMRYPALESILIDQEHVVDFVNRIKSWLILRITETYYMVFFTSDNRYFNVSQSQPQSLEDLNGFSGTIIRADNYIETMIRFCPIDPLTQSLTEEFEYYDGEDYISVKAAMCVSQASLREILKWFFETGERHPGFKWEKS